MSKNEHKQKSRYSAGFFLRLLALLALLGFVAFETNSAIQANETIDKVVNVFAGRPVADAEKILDRKPSKSRTETMKIDVDDIKKQIADAQSKLGTETDIIEKSKLEKKIAVLTPKLDKSEISYTVDTYRFLVNPFVGQFVEVAHKDGKIESILANEKFTLDSLKSDLGFEHSGREGALMGMGGAPPKKDKDEEGEGEGEGEEGEESSDGSESSDDD